MQNVIAIGNRMTLQEAFYYRKMKHKCRDKHLNKTNKCRNRQWKYNTRQKKGWNQACLVRQLGLIQKIT